MEEGLINLSRGDYMDNGVSPRQRKVYVLRWNPEVSSYTTEDFENDLDWFKDGAPAFGSKKWEDDKAIYWNVYDWKTVEYMDLFVMMMVGNGNTGVVGAGYLHSYPLREKMNDGKYGRTRFYKLDYMFMQDPGRTGLLTGEYICKSIPEVDWLHGHSGELISVSQAEKLALLMVTSLKDAENSEFLHFDDFSEKIYVLNDLMTFMCPALKKKLLEMGRNMNPEITDINNLMVISKDKNYSHWKNLEMHLELEKLNGLEM